MHICKPVIVTLVVVLLTAVHTLVFVTGDAVYSKVKLPLVAIFEDVHNTVTLVLSATIVLITGELQGTAQPFVLVSLVSLYALD